MNVDKLTSDWIKYKEAERLAVEARRECEDALIEALRVKTTDEGTQNFEVNGNVVKVVNRFVRKVDADKLQQIAIETGYQALLSELFRWKPEINMPKWKSTSTDVTGLFNAAITTSVGRPSFSIEPKTADKA